MESYNKKDNLIRAALFLEYKGECFYEGKPLRFNEMHIDHIIPETTSEQRLKEIINKLGLPKDFNINSLYNLVPCNPNINQVKNKNEYPLKFLGHCIHDGTYKKVAKVEKRLALLRKNHNNDKAIARLIASLEDSISLGELQNIYDALSKEEPFVEEQKINLNLYYNSKSKVQLRGTIPCYPDLKGNCLITFRNLRLRDCMISLNHEQILRKLFEGAKTELKYNLRGFLIQVEEEKTYLVDLGNVRVPMDEETVIQFMEIIDDFYEIYITKYLEIYLKFNWDKFDKITHLNHGLKLCDIRKDLWFDIMNFCNKFDYDKGNTKWHIFDSSGNMIKIYDKKTADFKAFILPRIEETSIISNTEEKVNLLWTDEFFWSKNLDDFMESKYWSPSFTYDWIIEKLIPQVIFEKLTSRGNLFQKKISFEDFIIDLNINDYLFSNTTTVDENDLLGHLEDLQQFFTGLPRLALYKTDAIVLYKCLKDILLKSELTTQEIIYIQNKLNLRKDINLDLIILDLDDLINEKIEDGNLISMFTIDMIFRCMVVVMRDCINNLTKTDILELKERLKKFSSLMNKERVRTV